ncbi:Ras-related protein Rab-3A [Dirofilaria immitis]|nr:Ras-related protein Rab-3A [Dirofilaria immitis]
MAAPGTGGTVNAPAGTDQNFDYMFKLLIIVGIDFKVKTVFRGDKRVKLQIWDTAGQERYRTITTAYYRGAMGFILMYDITNEESFNSVQDWSVFNIRFAKLPERWIKFLGNSHYKFEENLRINVHFKNIYKFGCTQIKTYSWENAQVVLVGNKCDMDDERVVSCERGRQLADQLGLEFFETSAKENINVKAVFEKLVEIICDKMAESLDSDPAAAHPKGQRLDAPSTQKPPSSQCNC